VLAWSGAPPLALAAVALIATPDAAPGLVLVTTTNTRVHVGLAAAPVATTVTPPVATVADGVGGAAVALGAGEPRDIGEAGEFDEHPERPISTTSTTTTNGQDLSRISSATSLCPRDRRFTRSPMG
jgi:hypothetical protein